MVQLLWIKYGGSSKKPKLKLPSWLGNPTSECTPKRTESEVIGDVCTPVFMVVLFKLAERGKQPKWPSTINE